MFRAFDVLNGDIPSEDTAKTIAEIAETNSAPPLDLAALVARFNEMDARINKIESQVNDAFKSQIEATSDAVEASNEIAENDNPGEEQAPAPDNSEEVKNDESE